MPIFTPKLMSSTVHAALHSPHHPMHAPIHIMTDSKTSLQLQQAQLRRPHYHRYHKHRYLIAEIVHNMLARTAPVRVSKVSAHIGVKGNTLADHLASQAHDSIDVSMLTFEDPVLRGPAWVQAPFHGDMSDVDTLSSHVLQPAMQAYTHAVHHMPDSRMPQTLSRIHAACNNGSGLIHNVSNAFWDAAKLTSFNKIVALKVRYSQLPTRARLAKWYPAQNIDPTCQLCHSAPDTIAHRLGACLDIHAKNQICARHGHAVHSLAEIISEGAFTDFALLSDAECHSRYTSLPRGMLPVSMQTSRPDIVIVEGFAADIHTVRASHRRDPTLKLHLVEVTFTSDFMVHNAVQGKQDQHRDLIRNLRDMGWQHVQLHVFVVGHTGVMRAVNAEILMALGVHANLVTPFLTRLAVDSLSRSCGILNLFHGSRSARDDAHHVSASHEDAIDGNGEGGNDGDDTGHGHALPTVGTPMHSELGVAAPQSDALLATSVAGHGVGPGQDLEQPHAGTEEPCAHIGSRALSGAGAQRTAALPSGPLWPSKRRARSFAVAFPVQHLRETSTARKRMRIAAASAAHPAQAFSAPVHLRPVRKRCRPAYLNDYDVELPSRPIPATNESCASSRRSRRVATSPALATAPSVVNASLSAPGHIFGQSPRLLHDPGG